LVHLFSELQFTVVEDQKNASIFTEILGFLDNKSVDVSASCGGVLSMHARQMSNVEKSALIESLAPEQREALVAVLPLESPDVLDFTSFNRISSLDKVRLCRRFLDKLAVSPSEIQAMADVVLSALLNEFSCQETDWTAIKPIIFSLDGLLVHCLFPGSDFKRAFLAVTFFANRWQRKLILFDDLSQRVNAVVWRLFDKLPLVQTFSALLEGMSRGKGNISSDCFYCKCWLALSDKVHERFEPGDASKLCQLATERQQEFGNDLRAKLCQALVSTVNRKSVPQKSEASPSLSAVSSTAPPVVVSRIEAKRTPRKVASNQKPTPTPTPAPTAEPSPVAAPEEPPVERLQPRTVAETNQVAELKARLQLLRQRWS
jgi:hypothetical protein